MGRDKKGERTGEGETDRERKGTEEITVSKNTGEESWVGERKREREGESNHH